MNLIFFLITLIIYKVSCESATCEYTYNIAYIDKYECEFSFEDPKELDRVTVINGDHMSNYSDDNVQVVYQYYNPSLESQIFPSIICEKYGNLDRIDFENFGFETIDVKSLEYCKNLEWLSLRLNKIKTLQKNLFQSNTKMERIYLNHNEIESLPAGIFDPLINLEDLDLSYNQLRALNSKLFAKNIKLKVLEIRANQIEELPEGVFVPLVNLEFLSIIKNKFSTLDSSSFGIHPHLEAFDFFSYYVNEVDERILDRMKALRVMSFGSKCDNIYGARADDSETKSYFRENLKECFENYKMLFSTTTEEFIE